MPERVRLRRTRGWRKPPDAIVVARPTRWGNPYEVGSPGLRFCGTIRGDVGFWGDRRAVLADTDLGLPLTAELAVALYRHDLLFAIQDWPDDHPDDRARPRPATRPRPLLLVPATPAVPRRRTPRDGEPERNPMTYELTDDDRALIAHVTSGVRPEYRDAHIRIHQGNLDRLTARRTEILAGLEPTERAIAIRQAAIQALTSPARGDRG